MSDATDPIDAYYRRGDVTQREPGREAGANQDGDRAMAPRFVGDAKASETLEPRRTDLGAAQHAVPVDTVGDGAVTNQQDLKLLQWQPLEEVLPKLRERMALNDGAEFITQHWDCKYIDARIDMRTGAVFLKPGNVRTADTRHSPHNEGESNG